VDTLKRFTALLLGLVLLLSACGGSNEDSKAGSDAVDGASAGKAASLSLAEVQEGIISSLGITEYSDIEPGRLLDLYGIEEADFTQSAAFVTMSGTFPHEAVMLEAADEVAAKRIAEKLQNRLDEVCNQYKDYDAESYDMAKACSVDTDGLVVSLFLSPDHAEMSKVLADALK